MYDEDDLSLLDVDETLASPLDQMAIEDDLNPVEPPPDVEEMLRLLQSPQATERMIATRAFCEIQDDRAIPWLIQSLTDGCPLVRVSAAYALGRNPSLDAVAPLIQQLEKDWNGYVRKGIVWALGNCHDHRVLQPLMDALQNEISAVRLWAASSLGQMAVVDPESATRAIPVLVQALAQDPMPAVRSNSAWALGQLGETISGTPVYVSVIEALIAGLQDSDIGVQDDSKFAMLKLAGPRGMKVIEELDEEAL